MAMDGTPIIIKRKKPQHGKSHGGSWKVAYADFVTAMMSFFLTLWIMGLSPNIKSVVAGYFNDPMGFTKTAPLSRNIANFHNMESPKPGPSKAPGTQLSEGNSDIVSETAHAKGNKKFKALGKQTAISVGRDGVRIEFSESDKTPFFERGSNRLTPLAAQYIAAVAQNISPTVRKVSDLVTVEGYTDATQYSGDYDNNDLSAGRALTLKHTLQENGFVTRMFAGVIGYGDKHLKDPNHPTAAKNRRVTLWIHEGGMATKLKSVFDTRIKEDLLPAPVQLGPESAGIREQAKKS